MKGFSLLELFFPCHYCSILLEIIEETRVLAASLHKVFELESLFSLDFDLELVD